MDEWKLEPARDIGMSRHERHRSLKRESGLVASVLRLAWWTSVRVTMALFHRLEIRGRKSLPQSPPFVLVSNHASHLDAIVLGCALPLRWRDQLFPLAAGDVFFETPALASFAANVLNAMPVWRRSCGAHAIHDLRLKLVEDTCVYILFPEGTRSRDGGIGTFKSGIGMLVAGTPVPVVPCHLQGTFESFPPNRVLPRLGKIVLRLGEPRMFESVTNSHDGWNQISTQLEAAIRQLAAAGV